MQKDLRKCVSTKCSASDYSALYQSYPVEAEGRGKDNSLPPISNRSWASASSPLFLQLEGPGRADRRYTRAQEPGPNVQET